MELDPDRLYVCALMMDAASSFDNTRKHDLCEIYEDQGTMFLLSWFLGCPWSQCLGTNNKAEFARRNLRWIKRQIFMSDTRLFDFKAPHPSLQICRLCIEPFVVCFPLKYAYSAVDLSRHLWPSSSTSTQRVCSKRAFHSEYPDHFFAVNRRHLRTAFMRKGGGGWPETKHTNSLPCFKTQPATAENWWTNEMGFFARVREPVSWPSTLI